METDNHYSNDIIISHVVVWWCCVFRKLQTRNDGN